MSTRSFTASSERLWTRRRAAAGVDRRTGGFIFPIVPRSPPRLMPAASPIYDMTVRRIDGAETSLGDFAGSVLLIVNVASQCGLTPQYDGLERLYSAYRRRGFAVLGFPSNEFSGQEPGT